MVGMDRGELTGPDGEVHRWRVRREGVSCPLEGEASLVNELARIGAAGTNGSGGVP
jgi:hypothetical protein